MASTRLAGRLLCGLVLLTLTPAPLPAAKYAGEFMRLGFGARSWAMGGAYVAVSSDATSVYWNPANLTRVARRDLTLTHAETFGSLLNYDAGAFALPSRRDDRPLVVGFAAFRLGGGGIQRTALANPNLAISDTNQVIAVGETVGHGDWAFYASAGRALTDRLDAGVSLKLIYRDLVDVSAVGFGFDAGVAYQVHPQLRGALALYDITTTLLAYDNGHKESVTPRVTAGAAYTPAWDRFALTASLDGVFEFEGRHDAAQFHQGEISLEVRWGLEVLYRERVALRGGMNADHPTLGVGIHFGTFAIDGAWRSHDVLDDSYRFSLSHNW